MNTDKQSCATDGCTPSTETCDRRDLMNGLIITLQHALMSKSFLDDIDAGQLYEYMMLMRRTA